MPEGSLPKLPPGRMMFLFPGIYKESRKLLRRYLKFLEAEFISAKPKSDEYAFYQAEMDRVKEVLKTLKRYRPVQASPAERDTQVSWHGDRVHEYHVHMLKQGDWMVRFEPEPEE